MTVSMFACLANVPWTTFQGCDIYIRVQHLSGSPFLPVHTGEGKLQLHSDKPHQRRFPYSQAAQLAGIRSPNTALCWQWENSILQSNPDRWKFSVYRSHLTLDHMTYHDLHRVVCILVEEAMQPQDPEFKGTNRLL